MCETTLNKLNNLSQLSTDPLANHSHPVPICPLPNNPRTATMASGDAKSPYHHSEVDGKLRTVKHFKSRRLLNHADNSNRAGNDADVLGTHRQRSGHFTYLIFPLATFRLYCSSDCQSVDKRIRKKSRCQNPVLAQHSSILTSVLVLVSENVCRKD